MIVSEGFGVNIPSKAIYKTEKFLEGYAAFTRDAPLAGRNLGRNAEHPIVKGTCVIAYTGTVWDPTFQ